MKVQPYVFFDGRCEEALEFYKKAVGAKVGMVMRYKDAPPEAQQQEGCGGEGGAPKASPEMVMHADFTVGETMILVADGMGGGNPKFEGFSLALSVSTIAECDRYFAGLSEGGQVIMPAGPTFFSPKFGMLSDKFGVMWMILVDSQKPA